MENSINYLIEKINSDCLNSAYVDIKLLNKVKQMYREEILNAYCKGAWDMAHNDEMFPREEAEQYYQKTYGGQ